MSVANILAIVLLTTAPTAALGSRAVTQADARVSVAADTDRTPAVTERQVQLAGRFLLEKAKLIATLAHPTLVLDECDGYADGDSVVLEFRYDPSGILGRRYTTRIRYRLDSAGIISSAVLHDDTVFGAFTGLELLKSFAADMVRQAREDKQRNNEEVSNAARLLESALNSNISGNEIHRLVLRVLWAQEGMVDRYNP